MAARTVLRFATLAALLAATVAGCAGGRRFREEETFPAIPPAAPSQGAKPLEAKPHEAKPHEAKPSAVGGGATVALDLPAVLALAGAHDLGIALARERLEESRAVAEGARLRFFPEIRTGVSFGLLEGQYMDTEGTFVDVTRQETRAGVRARLEVALGDAIFDLGTTARRLEAARESLDDVSQERLLRAATLYYDLLAAYQEREIADESLRYAEALETFHRSRLEHGLALPLHVERARARVEEERTAVAEAEARYRGFSVELARTLRLRPRVVLIPGDTSLESVELIAPSADADELVESALRNHPGLRAAATSLLAEESALEGARYGWLVPDLFAEGGLGGRGKNPSRVGGTQEVAVGLEWRVSLGRGAEAGAARARRNRAAIRLADLREGLIAGIVKILDEIELDHRRIEASERRIVAAQSAQEQASSRLRSGAGLTLEVLDAQVELTEARLARLRAVLDHDKKQAALLVLTGMGFPADPGRQ